MRCPLSHQVRQPVESLGSCGGHCSFCSELVVVCVGRQVLTEPMKAKPRTLCHAHHVPGSSNRMTEGMHTSRGIVGGRCRVRKHNARSSNSARDETQLHDAVANRTRSLITGATDNRDAFRESCALRCLPRYFPIYFLRPRYNGQNTDVQLESLREFGRPLPARDVEQRGPRCV